MKKLFGKGASQKPAAAAATPARAVSETKPAAVKSRSGAKASEQGKPEANTHRKRKRAPHRHKPWDLSQYVVAPAEGKTRFHDLNLPVELMHAIADLKYEYCSPIQAQTLPDTLQGFDVIGKGQTGTGKTAAFLITIINDFVNNPLTEERYVGEPRALIIAPTRELVVQIADDASKLLKYMDLNAVALIGGVDYDKQLKKVERQAVDIIVATPGRLLDFHKRGDLHLDMVEIMVIDEADRMLDMGFIPDVKRIISRTPKREDRQTLLFSATFTQDVLNLASQWTMDPTVVEIEPEHVATDTVEQLVYLVESREKLPLLKNILKLPDVKSIIIFANRRDTTRWLEERLKRAGFNVGMLSGEVPQNKRTRTLEQFKSNEINILVATDVAGRGIHVDGISHVVNFDVPEDPEDYVHRIGRTGRAGSTGTAYTFAGETDVFLLPDLEKLLGEKLGCQQPPEALLPRH
nr:ATP-dependent RNA helicase RhlB [Sinobacterium caligoides]